VRIELGFDGETLGLLKRLVSLVEQVEGTLMDVLTALEANVAADTTLDGSLATFISNLSAQATAAAPNNARLANVLATAQANSARVAALIVSNTPVASPNPVIPPPVPATAAASPKAV
jgi:hypothetical protein